MFKAMLEDLLLKRDKLNRLVPALEPLEDRSVPAAVIWNYSGVSPANWSLGSNWLGGVAPQAGDDVIFDGAYATGDCNWDVLPGGSGGGGSAGLPIPKSVTLKGNFLGTLNVLADQEVGAGGMNLDGGNVSEAGGVTLTVDGPFERSAGALDKNTQQQTASFVANDVDISGPSFTTWASWTIRPGYTADFHMYANSTVTFAQNNSLNIRTGATWNWFSGNIAATDSNGNPGGSGELLNFAGNIIVDPGSGVTVTCGLPIYQRFTAYLRVASGTFNVTGSLLQNGSIWQADGSLIITAGATLGASDGITMNGGAVHLRE
jgi:hypothetical protein